MVLSNLDRDLLNRCLLGTPDAWQDFVDRFLGLITYVVSEVASSRSLGLDAAGLDDVVADVFLALIDQDFRTLRRFRGQSSLGTYLVVVARRIAVRKLTEHQRRRQSSTAFSQPPLEEIPPTLNRGLASHASSSHDAARGDGVAASDEHLVADKEEVQVLLAQLPTTEATAVRMFHLEECTYREIGMHIGIPENSVGPLLSQARAKMRQMRQI